MGEIVAAITDYTMASGLYLCAVSSFIQQGHRLMKYTPKNNGVTARPPTQLLYQVHDRLRARHYSLRTEQACLSWTPRFILASGSLPQRIAYRSASHVDEIPSVQDLE